VYAVVNGFICTYLTANNGLDRYVVADSWIKPLGGYQSAIITTADTDPRSRHTAPASEFMRGQR